MQDLVKKSMDIDKLIQLASKKLYPIIEMLVANSGHNEQYLTIRELDNAITAAKIIRDLNKALGDADLKQPTGQMNFCLESYKLGANDKGKIYVQTILLLQLIDLYNILEEAKDIVDEYYSTIDNHSFVQTESIISLDDEESVNPNKIILRLTKAIPKSNTSLGLFQDFIVMPSTTDVNNDSAATSQLNQLQSTASIAQEEISEVTDVYGAKNTVVKCIYDLQEVSKYLGTERKEVGTICSRMEVDTMTPASEDQKEDGGSKRTSVNSTKSDKITPVKETDGEQGCCCPECITKIGSKSDVEECDDDKVIICIKGCNDEEGDVQIVIRQCPECKKTDDSPRRQSDKSSQPVETVLPKAEPTSDRSSFNDPPSSRTASREPSRINQSSTAAFKEPSTTSRQYSRTAYKEPSTTRQPSGTAYREPSTTRQYSETAYREPSASRQYSEAAYREPSATRQYSEAAYREPSATRQYSEAAYREPSATRQYSGTAYREPSTSNRSDIAMGNDQPKSFDTREYLPKEVESISLHNKDSQGSYVCSEESDEEKQYIPLPQTPPSSPSSENEVDDRISLPKDPIFSTTDAEPTDRQKTAEYQARVSCSKIKMFETTNLCLETDNGQDLIISLTITPKDFDQRRLSLGDIFSGEDNVAKEKFSITGGKRSSIASNDLSGERQKSTKSVTMQEPESYYVEERIIPLERTKVCSSMDFDVTTFESKIRNKGFEHKNAKIVVQLQELGVDNLLRACRPAKCCRRAILNEKMKKCLPYPPSLRSLPLDDDDITIINQSLQMSLQKVKNSMNLTKDYYTNQNYSKKPIQTIMYFFVDNSINITRSVYTSSFVKQKLGYYINLVNDLGSNSNLTYDVYYFGVEENNNLPFERKESLTKVGNNKPINSLEKITEALSHLRKRVDQQCSKQTELSLLNNKRYNDLLLARAGLQSPGTQFRPVRGSIQPQSYDQPNKMKKEVRASKIPVYQPTHKPKVLAIESTGFNVEHIEKEVYDISLGSLPRGCGGFKSNLQSGLETPNSFNSKSSNEGHNRKDFKQRDPQNYQNIRKAKKKKKIFYLSRSKSEVSLTTISGHKNRSVAVQLHTVSREAVIKTLSNTLNSEKSGVTLVPSIVKEKDSSKVILNYFTNMLYRMIMSQSNRESTIRSKKNVEVFTDFVNSKSMCIQDSNKPIATRNKSKFSKARINEVKMKSIHHDLKAKKSQSCILFSSETSNENDSFLNNLALQTSILFNDNKLCQTSHSLLTYFLKSRLKLQDTTLQNEKIFTKVYKGEALTGIPNSCDKLEKFIVMFKSEHSIKSNLSARQSMVFLASETSEKSLDQTEESLSNSLLKLRETLERYENVRNEITGGSLQEAGINPVEYFVYQMCACNRFNKKPSVMQKFLSKTKGLFSSTDHDICSKYKNQKDFFSMSSADKLKLCHRCGCVASKCPEEPSNKKLTDSSFLCQCPPETKQKNVCQCASENKPIKSAHAPCCHLKKKSGIKASKNLSKIRSASMSSFRSIKTCFKKSLSNITRSKEKSTGPCGCDKTTSVTKNIDQICIPKGLNVVECDKTKDISTDTMKNSATQKCECEKCETFAEDGTCCCSHCLGCLDKSSDAKPDSNNVGILCQCPDDLGLKEKSEKGDVTGTVNASKVRINETDGTVALPDTDSKDKESVEKAAVTTSSQSSSGKVVNLDEEDIEEATENIANNNDRAAYYFFAAPPTMFNQFGAQSVNPIEYLLNYPQINVIRINNSQTSLN